MPDASALARLHAEAFTLPRPWSAAEITAVLAGEGAFLLGESDGFLIGRAVAGEAELLTLAVAASARRQGLGGRLVRGFLAEAARRGADRAFLEVAADNAAALSLYAAAGFTGAGRRRGYYRAAGRPAVDALVLTRPVPPPPVPPPPAPPDF